MKKIISRSHALRLIRQGKATAECVLMPDDRGNIYTALTRYDTQETIHAAGIIR